MGQQPLVCIGATIHIGDWIGVVESINRNGVILKLDNGKILPVSREVIEQSLFGGK